MTLPVTPNAISLNDVNVEMNKTSGTQISLNQNYCTTLSGQTGPYDMDTLHGKARNSGTATITTGSSSFTVPLGVIALTISIRGGHGGQGGTDVYAGQVGWGGTTVSGTIAVTAGQVYQYWCGANGGNGVNGAGPGTAGGGGASTSPAGTGSVNFSGGAGGGAGSYPSSNSGGGAGGGGASGLYLGTTAIAIAGGGAGGAGAGKNGGGSGQAGTYVATTYGGVGSYPVNADFGGDGGGGGGYPFGGVGGTYQAQDYFGSPGTTGQSLTPSGCIATAGTNAATTPTASITLTW